MDNTRHAGHADILREQLDGAIGLNARMPFRVDDDSAFWAARRAAVEQSARAVDPGSVP